MGQIGVDIEEREIIMDENKISEWGNSWLTVWMGGRDVYNEWQGKWVSVL